VRDVVFAPIRGEGLAYRAVRRIAEGISLGLLKEGDRLPRETQLAGRLGISLLTLREALAILRQAGYVETVRGRRGGTFVRSGPVPPTDAESRRVVATLTPDHLRELTDARVAVGGHACALAAERAGPEQVAHIAGLNATMCRTSDYDSYRRLDAEFHIALASASGSARLAALEVGLQGEVDEALRAIHALIPSTRDPVLTSSNHEHTELVRAVEAHDPERARHAMTTHALASLDVHLAVLAALTLAPGPSSAEPLSQAPP
jgi:GntR family transcriptional regulator, transcriptional repressor for pyruvate dehydrogenase complex